MKRITRIKCIVPFTNMFIHKKGYCYSCCPNYSKLGNIGRLSKNNSIMEIWNNKRIQYLRKAILDDKLENVCNFKYCPVAIKNVYLNLENIKNDDPNFNHIVDQIIEGRTILDKPPNLLEIASSERCNLKCIMCRTNNKTLKSDDLLEEKLFTQIIPEHLPDISNIVLSSYGEVFFNPYSRKFLQLVDLKSYPFLKINLITNGLLLTPKFWESIKHNTHFEYISVSIDAASKKTYEYIRRNGDWDVLQKNLNFISELRRKNIFTYFCISFIVMKSNYTEMKEFVEFGLSLGCDRIIFQKISGLNNIRENINFINDKKIFIEIANILNDPIFIRPEVDVTMINEYKKYFGKRVSFWYSIITKVKNLFYFPIIEIILKLKYFSFDSYIYEFIKKNLIKKSKLSIL